MARITQGGGTGGGGAVASVNSKTGTVVLTASDVGADASGAATAAAALRAPLLTPTAVKTAAYTAAVGDIAMMNVAGGATALTLPAAPADKAQVGYRAIGATTAVPLVITRGGSDTIGTTGATSTSIPLADEVAVLQYDAANTRWLAVANVKTQAALDGRYMQPTKVVQSGPLAGAYQVVQATSNATDTGVNTMIKYAMPTGVEVDVLRLRFSNTQCGSNGDLDAANAITLTASVGLTATGPWFPVRLRGSRTMSLDAGADIETDPLWVRLVAGATFYVKTFVSVTSGQTWPAQIGTGSKGTDYWVQQSTSETDLTQSTAAFTASTGTTPFMPVALIADRAATQASIAFIGDSILGGVGDTGVSQAGFGYRALQGQLPYSRISVSGSKLKDLIDPNVGRRRLVLIRGANTALVMYGTNDVFVSTRTLAQLQADHITLWTFLRNMGIKPQVCTLVPQTTSTDSWATTANQTTKTGETVRAGFNDWIRDGAPLTSASSLTAVAVGTAGALRAGAAGHPLAGYFETADIAETARNSGLWKVTGAANYATADGTHPTTAMHTLLAAAITPATFTALASS